MSDLGRRQMHTGVWYGDDPLLLRFPADWHVTAYWPSTPAPLTAGEIATELENPVGQPPIRELCRGKTKPLIIVDDLNRPTPAAEIIPVVLKHMQKAGIPSERVTIMIAPGTHSPPTKEGIVKKVGAEPASRCRVLVHDCRAVTKRIGTTAAGTPVFVNPQVLASDFVVGIGGVYPNYTAGFGGGVKLALGVLGRRSILHLHYGHRSMNGVYYAENSFRRDLAEIAAMIGLNTTISVHVDEARNIVRLQSGDHRLYYAEAAEFSREAYQAPGPGDADVVISNTYPEDLSLVFARMKGFAPLRRAKASASLVAIARCAEGVGTHGLFPEFERTRKTAARDLVRRLSVMSAGEILGKLSGRLKRPSPVVESETTPVQTVHRNPIWLYVAGLFLGVLPQLPGIRITQSWDEVLGAIEKEQSGRKEPEAAVYPCAPLQCVSDRRHEDVKVSEKETVSAK